MSVVINLDDLTQEHVDRCAPHLRGCLYSAPCIIGTLIPEPLGEDHDDTYIASLLEEGIVRLPDDQWQEAQDLQAAFDGGDVASLTAMLAARDLKWPSN